MDSVPTRTHATLSLVDDRDIDDDDDGDEVAAQSRGDIFDWIC